MLYLDVPKMQTLELDFDKPSGRPTLLIKQNGAPVARIIFHTEQAELAAQLLAKGAEQAKQKQHASKSTK